MRLTAGFFLLSLTGVLPLMQHACADESNLALPSDNDALFRGDGAAFYQHIRRDYKGVVSFPWQGGQYGFVRNPIATPRGLVYTRFHEGVDIRPVQRDQRGEPLDVVRAIADGTVAHVNLVPGYSNYGRYVVVEHRWDGASYYSLYGHLASTSARAGEKVDRGDQLGVIGYTGAGLDQSRAHLHLELNLMLGRRFESWYDAFEKEPNRHGIFNGINLTGVDIARLYLALRKRPSLTIPEFLAGEETFYKVTLPPSRNFDLPERYPWLLQGAKSEFVGAWDISFNRAGVPLKVEAKERTVPMPTLSYVKKQSGDYSDLTRGVIRGTAENASLSENGQKLMRLLIWPD
ncbi:MAG: M23 family metallopeptidase [Chthoniobacterales bacterium]|nr:M23 family metallopeptidase [Chthoniobacterales bacterium]